MDRPAEYLIAFDFDGTLADTFAKSPRGIGVNEASAQAVKDLFGKEGERALQSIGGLRNRAPVELINALLVQGDKTAMTGQAREYARKNIDELFGNVPSGKGVALAPLLEDGEVDPSVLAEAFVRRKLSILTKEISPEWPKPMEGLVDALSAIRALGRDGVSVRIGVLSSGHELFIRKCFEVWGIPAPDILITDDDLRGVKQLSSEAKIKPSVHLLAKLHQAWRRARGLRPDDIDLALEKKMRTEGLMYAGDDQHRDGRLALQSDVLFGWYKPGNGEEELGENPLLFRFSHWDELTEFLTAPGLSERLLRGEPLYALLGEMRMGLPEGRFPDGKRPL